METLQAGPAALARRAEVFEVFRIHTGGVDELIRECLRERGAEALPELAEPAARATLAMFGD